MPLHDKLCVSAVDEHLLTHHLTCKQWHLVCKLVFFVCSWQGTLCCHVGLLGQTQTGRSCVQIWSYWFLNYEPRLLILTVWWIADRELVWLPLIESILLILLLLWHHEAVELMVVRLRPDQQLYAGSVLLLMFCWLKTSCDEVTNQLLVLVEPEWQDVNI